MKFHFIAIGGSIMHNLAIALKNSGNSVTGSDDEIYDPAKTLLAHHGLLPATTGWDSGRITSDIDAIILGMHARADNPELIQAMEMCIPVYSFPQFVFQQTKHQKRVVIAGSHGKTTTTAMVMHVLRTQGYNFNYLVGARLEGFDTMVRLDPDADVVVIEGDEYLTSPLDRTPKFLHYQPHIALITGIAWDHMNAFPTFAEYVDQFRLFGQSLMPAGDLIYYSGDEHLSRLLPNWADKVRLHPYEAAPYRATDTGTEVTVEDSTYPLQIFGRHNLENAMGACHVCGLLGVSEHDFWQALTTFKGAAKRLQLLGERDTVAVFRDFAHAPSKVKASVQAMRERYPTRRLTAVLELHTFSSLNPDFIVTYAHTLDEATSACVYLNPEALAKKGKPMTADEVRTYFQRDDLLITSQLQEVEQFIVTQLWTDNNLLLMSSGNLGGLDLVKLGTFIQVPIN